MALEQELGRRAQSPRRHLATSAAPPPASARRPASRASTAAECNAVHCRPNTVFCNESPSHFPPTPPRNILPIRPMALAWRGVVRLSNTFPPLRQALRFNFTVSGEGENEINDGVMQTWSAPAAHGKCRDASTTAFSLHSSASVESKMWKIAAAAALRQGNRVAKSKNLMAKPACLSRQWLHRPPAHVQRKVGEYEPRSDGIISSQPRQPPGDSHYTDMYVHIPHQQRVLA